ncbi:MAG: MlaD family protein [Gammaproteobacteria bacterium]|nr:MlaD family protein [Gammaproteobacteria bacterium]
MQTRPPYAVVGLFVVLLTSAVIVTGVWFGFGDFEAPSRTYATYLTDSVAGLRENSTVRYRGVDVGRVRQIRLAPGDPGQVRLLLDIDREVPILTDTVARLSTQGLTGLSYIELTSDGNGEPLAAREGEPYPVIQSRPSLMGRLDAAGTSLLARVDEVSHRLVEAAGRISALFDDPNRRAIATILAELSAVAEVLGRHTGTLDRGLADLGTAFSGAARAGERLPGLVTQSEEALRALEGHAAALASAAGSVERLAETLRTESARLGGDLDRVSTLTEQELARFASETHPAMTAMLRDLDDAARALRRFAETLERDPSLLLHGPRGRPLGPGEGDAR